MKNQNNIFKKNYKDYLKQLAENDFNSKKDILGIEVIDDKIIIPFFGRLYSIYPEKIIDQYNMRPDYSHCVVFCKYLLLCPDENPKSFDWISYKDFKDSAPLVNYFEKNTHIPIAKAFTNKINYLKKACDKIGGESVEMDLPYDIVRSFNVLPKIPILFLFNDGDDEFSADCKILFQKCADQYLDAECLAILGALFAEYLQKAAGFRI